MSLVTTVPDAVRQLFIVDHSLSSKSGHYFEYSRSVAQGAAQCGWEVRILANRQLRLDDGESLAEALGVKEVRPVFDYGWSRWSDIPPHQPIQGHFGHDVLLELAAAGVGPADLVLIHTLGWSQLSQLLWSLAAIPPWRAAKLPRFSIVLRYDPRDLDTGYSRKVVALCNRLAANKRMAARVRFHTDTDRLTALCGRLLKVQASTLPIPFDQAAMLRALEKAEDGRGSGKGVPGPLTLVYIGDAREEKGYPLLPEMVRQLWESYFRTGRLRLLAQSNFNIAGGEATVPEARQRLRQFPSPEVHLLTSALDTDAYYGLLAAADIVLIPYNPERYQARSSGIMVQAQCAGKVVVTSSGSWMETRAADGTVTFDGPATFVDAVRRAVDGYEVLHRQAVARTEYWRSEASADHFVKVLEQAHDWTEVTTPVIAGPTVLFVMDADAMVLRNGASSVARSQLEGLFDLGCRVTGLFVHMTSPATPEALFAFARTLDETLAEFPFVDVHLCSYAPDATSQASHDLFRAAEQKGDYSIERDIRFRDCLQLPAALWRSITRERPGLIVLNYITNLPLLDKLGLLEGPQPVPVLCEIHDIQSFQKAIYGQRDLLNQDLEQELAMLARSAMAVSLSTLEADLLRRYLPSLPVRHLPAPIPANPIGHADLAAIPGLGALPRLAGSRVEDRQRFDALTRQLAGWRKVDLLFVSSAHKPNIDALRWFLEKVFLPLLAPMDMTLAIVGDVADQQDWPIHPSIALVGRVSNLRPFYAAAHIVILPIFSGAGSPIKVQEALSLGRAVVGTSYALQQLVEGAGIPLPIADTPERFGQEICRLSASRAARAEVALAGLAIARMQQTGGGRAGRFAQVAAQLLGMRDIDSSALSQPAPAFDYQEWNEDWHAINGCISLLTSGEPAPLSILRRGAALLEGMDAERRISLLASHDNASHLAQLLPEMLKVLSGQTVWAGPDGRPVPVVGGRMLLFPGSAVRNWVVLPADTPFHLVLWCSNGQAGGASPQVPGLHLSGVQSAHQIGTESGRTTFQCRTQAASMTWVMVGIELRAHDQPVVIEDCQLSIRHVPWLQPGEEAVTTTFDPREGWQGIAKGANGIPFVRGPLAGPANMAVTQLCGWRPTLDLTLLDLGARDWRSLQMTLGHSVDLPVCHAEPVVGGIRVLFHDSTETRLVETGTVRLLSVEAERGLALASMTQTVSLLPPSPAEQPSVVAGHVDSVSDDGRITGWACDPAAPRHRLVVEAIVDGEPLVSVTACDPRPDVRMAGFGDGHCGFSLALPVSARGKPFRVQIANTSSIIADNLIWP
ncbi:glycosyltransferase [Niveispirillum sp. BGYR6]|uniref:glycosyltransferase n=1 Tax=Niveispirillum sp. BGYR6 TaxID=2971249 RepID=UPI0022B972D5|nr:glycosyltransferase [Niveispirillum sp. BGYR6]MDG5497429.1 glycosyltransferase [Niveispirillum sp. BGYR6]